MVTWLVSPRVARSTGGVLVVHLCSTMFLLGTQWWAQVVHFALLNRIGPDSFGGYMRAHDRSFWTVIFIPWVVDTVTLLMLLRRSRRTQVGSRLVAVDAVLAAVTGVVTFALVVPQIIALTGHGFEPGVYRALLAWNWVRTTAWTGKAVVVAVMLTGRLRPALVVE